MQSLLLPVVLLSAACAGAEASEREIADMAATQYQVLRISAGASANSCMQAGMVAETFLRAGDQEAYRRWKLTEAADCEEAGYEKHVH